MQFLTTKEVMEKTRASRSTVNRWVKDREQGFPLPAKIGRRTLWVESQLDEWIERTQAQAQAEKEKATGQSGFSGEAAA